MPRKSTEAKAITVDVRHKRLQQRAGMSKPIAAIFAEIVAAVPPTHFRAGDAPLVEQYAQSIQLARQAYTELESSGPIREDGKRSPWVDVLEKAHRSSVALSARLRLAPQQRTDPKTAGRQPDSGFSPYDTMRND